MSEFGQDDRPELSMGQSPQDFNDTLLGIADTSSDDLAYAVYGSCLEEDPGEQPEADIGFKRGLLFKFMGKIEQNRGDWTDALASYRQARSEIEGLDELWSLELFAAEGHLLMHELNDSAASIEPYEEVVRIFESHYVGPESKIAPDRVFNGYTDVMSHLASAYRHSGETEEVRRLNSRLVALGRMSGAMFGFDSCGHGHSETGPQYEEKPLFKEIREKLGDKVSPLSAEQRIEGLRSLEKLIDREDFMPGAPEQRENILMMIYGKYGMLLPNLDERELYINRALKIANRHDIVIPKIDLHISMVNNQVLRGRPLNEQHKTAKKALLAVEASLDAGASVEAVRIAPVTELLVAQMTAKRDYIGIERLKRRLATRGLRIQSTMHGAARPNLN